MLSRENFDAVLFDLDGVLTDTARIHSACWKRMFDSYLELRPEPFVPFDPKDDYKHYVDGKLRYDGVRSFLESRQIRLPEGAPEDGPEMETVSGLGNRKDAYFAEVLASEGVDIFAGSLDLVRHLRRQGMKTAVVSASKNCQAVLQAVGIEDLFDLRVDGKVAAQMQLAGKPAPDTFLKAAQLLGVEPGRAVVVEDAISGVQAGRAGNFGLVIGVDRHDHAAALKTNGADIVLTDLADLLP